MVTTGLGNFGKGFLHGLAFLIVVGGAALVKFIPASVMQVTVGSVITWIIAWAGHALATPAGSRISRPFSN
jgi:hypothetical protein